jgi:hypothetical protein
MIRIVDCPTRSGDASSPGAEQHETRMIGFQGFARGGPVGAGDQQTALFHEAHVFQGSNGPSSR